MECKDNFQVVSSFVKTAAYVDLHLILSLTRMEFAYGVYG
jgi:hypothetical protein